MADTTATTGVATDFSGFAKLRAEARAQAPEALEKTAKQFEALFTQMLLKNMRAVSFGDDGLGAQGDMYKSMFDQQLAVTLSSGKGIGIADMMVHQLQRQQGEASVGGASAPTVAAHAAPTVSLRPADHLSMTLPAVAHAAQAPEPVAKAAPVAKAGEAAPLHWPPKSPREFLDAVWPHAVRAAKAIGVSAKTLVAQIALETGWGKHVAADRHSGKPSFNLFGIKADQSWVGDKVKSATHEIVDGVQKATHAAFRSYDSVEHAFNDYVDFVQSNPRYAQALKHTANYAAHLQKAGYATDPHYAAKIHKIEMKL